jgi:SAM-dependent methyltransferase
MNRTSSEAHAVAERYARRENRDLYSMLRPEVLLAAQERQRKVVDLLRRHAPAPPAQLRLLEVGCGMGGNLLGLLQLGFDPTHLVGSELLPQRAAHARSVLPEGTAIHEGDAVDLPFEPAAFDVVYVSLVFSSLLSDDFQARLAAKMWSWLRPGGGVLWYDFVYDNPSNRDVRGVPVNRVRNLFPAADLTVRRVTLAPPLSRRVCRVHPSAYHLLNALPFLRTHRLCWIGKRATEAHA